MALFPKCEFQVLLTSGVVTSGAPLEGILELTVPEPIPRAERIDLFYRNNAWVGYGSGKQREVIRRNMLVSWLRVDLPVGQPLPAGTFRYPFRMELPPWVSPTFAGNDCAIENVIEARLDVDWAKDPVSIMRPVVVLPPSVGVELPVVTRSPANFHESIVLEVTLQSSVVIHGQPFVGHIALRGGHRARFDAVTVTLASVAHALMGRGDWRRGLMNTVRIPADRLRQGESVPFLIPSALPHVPACFRNGFLDHEMILDVTVDIPWASDPSFTIRLDVLPAGSTLQATGIQEAPVGSARLQALSQSMARATGLRPGRLPTLVEGPVDTVGVRITDSPRGSQLGVDVDFLFPSVELGTTFRPLGVLDGFRDSPLLPATLRVGYFLRFEAIDSRPSPDDGALEAYAHAVLDALGGGAEIRFSDHHLGAHFPLANDSSDSLDAVGRFACDKAKAIAGAIAALPFPAAAASARPAWQATAREQSAVLVPSGPSLHGLVFRSRILGGEQRLMGASVRTTWPKDGPQTIVDLDLRTVPLTRPALAELENANSEGLRAVRAVFSEIHARGVEYVVLERPSFTADPRALLPAIEAFLAWLLECRGERRADAPYR